ncbi:MAG TPA: hypothetical protein VFV00_14450 [Acidimicrobiales bacterium]|nr:hypothetical protein [Acidimicrobiales bacterium]
MDSTSQHAGRSRGVALVETADPYPTVLDCLPLVDAGYDVVVCAGPQADQLCPALDGLPCPLVREVDIVINAVKDPVTQAAVADGIRRSAPDVAVVVIAAPATDVIDGCVAFPDVEHAAQLLRRRAGRRCQRGHTPKVTVFP